MFEHQDALKILSPATGRSKQFSVAVWALILLIWLPGCRRDPSLFEIKNLSGDSVLVFGHGGMGQGHRLPMNSMAALNTAVDDLGAHGVEMDVQLSLDSQLILFHDLELETSTRCAGEVQHNTAGELLGCRYKKDGGRHHIVDADRFFRGRKHDTVSFYTIDVKLPVHTDPSQLSRWISKISGLRDLHRLENRLLVESGDPGFIALAAAEVPDMRLYFYVSSYQQAIRFSDSLSWEGITIDMDKISADQVKDAHRRGWKVTLFGADTERRNTEALRLSPDHIQTDRPAHLMDIVRRLY